VSNLDEKELFEALIKAGYSKQTAQNIVAWYITK
jgi:hypothetical protein